MGAHALGAGVLCAAHAGGVGLVAGGVCSFCWRCWVGFFFVFLSFGVGFDMGGGRWVGVGMGGGEGGFGSRLNWGCVLVW